MSVSISVRERLVPRALVRETSNLERLFRVVWVDGSDENVWLFDVNASEWPFPLETSSLLAGFELKQPAYEIAYVEQPWPIRYIDKMGDSRSDVLHRKAWSIVSFLTAGDHEHSMLFDAGRRTLLATAMVRFETTRPTVVSTIRRFWQRGMVFEALRPSYDRCGAPGKSRNIVSGKKVGRPRTIAPGIGITVNDEHRKKLQIGADYYLLNRKASQEDALNHVVQRFYSVKPSEPISREPVSLNPDRPTLGQFKYFLLKNCPNHERFRARSGEKREMLEARAILGKGDHNTFGPGDKFQVDATIADLYLVSQFDRRRIVGRPVIYFVIDVWSRLITGVYVGFEGPSWIGAMMVLTNMVMPKEEFCRRYDVDIDPDEWPSHHLPRTLLADRGELMSVDLGERIVKSLNIQIENTSPGRGDLKAIVERRFGIVPAKFKQFIPGYVEADFNTRGGEDYRLEAVFDLRQFTQMVILAVVEHNHDPITNLKVPAGMITDGLTASPIDLWRWGIEKRSGALRKAALDDVAINVMPRVDARVTPKGIRFKGGFYTCSVAEKGRWFRTARVEKEWTVRVAYDPRDLAKIYLLDAGTDRGFDVCELLDPYEELKGKTVAEYEEKERAAKIVLAARADDRQARHIATDIKMKQIETEARKMTEAVREVHQPKSRRLADIKQNKSEEKEFQRGEEVIDLSIAEPPSVPDPTDVIRAEEPAEDPHAFERNALAKLRRLKESGGIKNG
jgi:hypothetical protein